MCSCRSCRGGRASRGSVLRDPTVDPDPAPGSPALQSCLFNSHELDCFSNCFVFSMFCSLLDKWDNCNCKIADILWIKPRFSGLDTVVYIHCETLVNISFELKVQFGLVWIIMLLELPFFSVTRLKMLTNWSVLILMSFISQKIPSILFMDHNYLV